MARIAGVNIPTQKRVEIGLRYIHGIGPQKAKEIIEKVGISSDTIKLLQARGHKIHQEGYWSDGECIAVDPKTGELLGAPDGRNDGKAVGY